MHKKQGFFFSQRQTEKSTILFNNLLQLLCFIKAQTMPGTITNVIEFRLLHQCSVYGDYGNVFKKGITNTRIALL